MFFERLFNVIAPHECFGCGAEGSLLCKACTALLPEVPMRCYRCAAVQPDCRICLKCRAESPLFQVMPTTTYSDMAQRLVRQLKFERAQAAAQDIAAAMVARLPVSDWIVTHLPTAPTRVRQRGYDQARLIAREVARLTVRPYAPLLIRIGKQRQLGQSRAVRQKQLEGAFRAAHVAQLHGRHVLLIDDVLTTGASCEAASKVLLAAGAHRVSAAVFAVV